MNISPMSNRPSYNIIFNKNNNENNSKSNNESKSLQINKNKTNGKSIVNNLEKCKENLLEQKQKLQGEEMTPEEKLCKMKEINDKIYKLEAEINNAKTLEIEKEKEKIKEKFEKNNQETEKCNNEKDVVVAESLQKLIDARQNLKNIKTLKSTKTNLSVELSYLENVTPQRLDNTSTESFVSKQKQKLQKGISNLEHKIYEEIANSNKKIDKLKEKPGSEQIGNSNEKESIEDKLKNKMQDRLKNKMEENSEK